MDLVYLQSQEYTHDSQLECGMNDIHPEAEAPLLCAAPTARRDFRIKGTASEEEETHKLNGDSRGVQQVRS